MLQYFWVNRYLSKIQIRENVSFGQFRLLQIPFSLCVKSQGGLGGTFVKCEKESDGEYRVRGWNPPKRCEIIIWTYHFIQAQLSDLRGLHAPSTHIIHIFSFLCYKWKSYRSIFDSRLDWISGKEVTLVTQHSLNILAEHRKERDW